MKYDTNYFIKKLEAIPEDRWCIFQIVNSMKQHCAVGHCSEFGETSALRHLFATNLKMEVTTVNDYKEIYLQPHPKQRILAALYDIKSLEAVKEAEQIIKDKPESHNERMDYEDRQSELTECTREDFAINWREGK